MSADPVPIILSPQPNTARVAPELADKDYAATRKLWYIRPSRKPKGLIGWMPLNKLYSTYMNRMRQPVESLFRWLIGRVGLQDGSRIRSGKGVWLHCFGRLAAGQYVPIPFQIVSVVFSFTGSVATVQGKQDKFTIPPISENNPSNTRFTQAWACFRQPRPYALTRDVPPKRPAQPDLIQDRRAVTY